MLRIFSTLLVIVSLIIFPVSVYSSDEANPMDKMESSQDNSEQENNIEECNEEIEECEEHIEYENIPNAITV